PSPELLDEASSFQVGKEERLPDHARGTRQGGKLTSDGAERSPQLLPEAVQSREVHRPPLCALEGVFEHNQRGVPLDRGLSCGLTVAAEGRIRERFQVMALILDRMDKFMEEDCAERVTRVVVEHEEGDRVRIV